MKSNQTGISLSSMEEKAGQASRLLKALSNECRLLILCNLVGGEKSVTQLNDKVDLSQSALSQHLARLRNEGLVAIRKEAQTVYYRIDSPEVEQVIRLMYDLYCRGD
ncbi:ArsR/SmtB family transcription factor [Saccharospirillum salsuginis]|uniref:Transcriptional regulator n=1 Tax=Saccharospirillum salsuginis TaxID=418750 RepID=A0A918KHR4_9GAMM|nr:metalloregulator ArsR/SmtB family transcription factor [Saccharospirillum salsuginis]GGX64340.1 transcriptional regulator [Saccharospirillum salsuginis]